MVRDLDDRYSAVQQFASDAAMKVSLEVLGRVYDNMRNQGDRSLEDSNETLDPDSHLHIVDAFDMPLWHWSGERGTFEK